MKIGKCRTVTTPQYNFYVLEKGSETDFVKALNDDWGGNNDYTISIESLDEDKIAVRIHDNYATDDNSDDEIVECNYGYYVDLDTECPVYHYYDNDYFAKMFIDMGY